MTPDFVAGFLAAVVVFGFVVAVIVDLWRDSVNDADARANHYQALAERAVWDLTVERAAIKRERERARTDLAGASYATHLSQRSDRDLRG